MKNFKRILSLLLAVLMTVGMAAVAVADNVSFTDVSGHWAWTGGQIPYLVSKNVLNGYKQANGTYTFQPDGKVTRAEFIKMLDETFGLKETASLFYNDVAESDWFAPYFKKAAAQGYLLNYGSSVNPNGQLTREEAISLLVRYLNLSADEQEVPSYFGDYASIADNFKSYVMEAVYAGVVDGYTDTGTRLFQPKRVLTRAEALTILYRAAGAIFNGTTAKRDSGAPATNNTFVTGGSTAISDLTFDGRSIVSEGADAGTLTFVNCRFNGPLTIRGGADVLFYNTTANEVTVEGGGAFSLLDRASVKNLTIEKCSDVTVGSNTSVNTLTVRPSAYSLIVRGDGAIGTAVVQATGLVCSIMPDTYEIADGLSALFAGTSLSGNTNDQKSFESDPFVFTDGVNAYAAVKPAATGTVFGYYTNSESVPAPTDYSMFWAAAEHTIRFNADGGKWVSYSGHTSASVGQFRYLVLQLQKDNRLFRPVVVECDYEAESGFASGPNIVSNSLSFRAEKSGPVYWFYTASGAERNPAEFLADWDSAPANLRGTGNASSFNDFYITLNANNSETYGYIAVMLKNTTNGYYKPVILTVGNTGFSEGPKVKTAGTISFKTREAGTLFYYFAESNNPPTADKFLAEYNAAEYRDSVTVRAGMADEFRFDNARTGFYPYIVIALRVSTNTYRQPVVLSVNVDTGFETDPAILREGEIRFATDKIGTVKYYYTNASSAPTAEEFATAYNRMDYTYRGSMDINTRVYTIHTLPYYVQYAATRPYMVLMFTDEDGKNYCPVLVELTNQTGNGFKVEPYVNGDSICFTTEKSGKVLWFYTTSPDPIAADDFYLEYNSSRYIDAVEVTGGVPVSKVMEKAALNINKYAVLAFLPAGKSASNRDNLYPYVLDLRQVTETSKGTGLNVSYDTETGKIIVTPEHTGTVYYYFTDDYYELPLGTTFSSAYGSILGGGDSIDVTIGSPKLITAPDKKYAVLCLRANNQYFDPVTINLESGHEYSNGIDDGHTLTGTGFNYARMTTDNEVVFETKVSGTVTLLYVENGNTTRTNLSVRAEANVAGRLALPSFNDIITKLFTSNGSYAIQLETDSGELYEAYKLY